MSQFSVTCSNAFSSHKSPAGSFTNELAQPLDFGRASSEQWRVSLGELCYSADQLYNLRNINNRLDITIKNWYYPVFDIRNVDYMSWEYPTNPQYFLKPGKVSETINTAYIIEELDMVKYVPGHATVFDPNAESLPPYLRLYFCTNIKKISEEIVEGHKIYKLENSYDM